MDENLAMVQGPKCCFAVFFLERILYVQEGL